MRRFVLFAVILLVAVGVVFALIPRPEPPEFVSKEHHFRAKFGGAPEIHEKAGTVTKTTHYTVESPDGALIVAVIDLPVPDHPTTGAVELYLDTAKDDLIRIERAERISDGAITLAGKYPGREFTAKFQQPAPGVMRARIYFVGKRLYQVMVKGTEDYANSKEATAFLDSFMVTSE